MLKKSEIVELVIKRQLDNSLLREQYVLGIVDDILLSKNINPGKVSQKEKDFIVSMWKAKIQSMIEKL